MARIKGWKPKVDKDGRVRLVKPSRKLDASAKIRQRKSKRAKAVSPGRAALLGMIR